MTSIKSCFYCQEENIESNIYECNQCGRYAHFDCINGDKPSSLKGDTLFEYLCHQCSRSERDELRRPYLNWSQIVHLSLYNLSMSESGRKGYFRWKEDICSFIERNWNILMPEREKTLNWINTVAGVLSVHSKKVFKSGQSLFGETGWWTLSLKNPPMKDNETYKLQKSYAYDNQTSQYKPENLKSYGRSKRQRKENKPNNQFEDVPKKVKCVKINMPPNKRSDDKPVIKSETADDNQQFFDSSTDDFNQLQIKSEPLDIDWKTNMESKLSEFDSNMSDMISCSDVIFDPINEVLNSNYFNNRECASPTTSDYSDNTYVGSKTIKQDDNFMSNSVSTCVTPSLIVKNNERELVQLTINEETEFLSFINSCKNALESDASVRRLRRKLALRKLKRNRGLPVFNLDSLATHFLSNSLPDSLKFLAADRTSIEMESKESSTPCPEKSYINHPALQGLNILDRFIKYQPTNLRSNISSVKSFIQLIGISENNFDPQEIISPYTSRVLKPFIRRDFESKPPKLKLLSEICRSNKSKLNEIWPIDYCYVQPNHIPAVNSLCSEFFWPGIDLTECLQYPEFSCIVLYKKLLIGCAFMVPDVNYNEAYISFILVHPDWRGAGIGTYMIYHLIQTCMGKDITLHVAPSNPSMLLYQKFGFKNEEFILDFYDKYIPAEQVGSRHAFFLRLQR